LGGLRRRIEIAMLPDDVDVVLQLDGLAAAHPEPVIAVMNARRRATGQRRGWLLPLSRWRSPCWPRTSRCRTVPDRACTRGDAAMMPALKIERCEQSYTDTDARSAQTYSYGELSVISPRPKSARGPSPMSSVGVCLV
jgi:hypothetical protein